MGRHARAVGSAMTIRVVVVFDLDGVVRHWDAQLNASIERRHGLPPDSILDTAFAADLGEAAVTGALDYGTWAARVAERLGSPEAVAEWGAFRGHVDPDAVELVAAVRAGGCRAGLLSNATTRLEEDLAVLGLDATFDVVFNTARLGVCKPDHEVYRRVVDALGVPADHVVFTDDTPSWAEAAQPPSGSTASRSPGSPTSATSSTGSAFAADRPFRTRQMASVPGSTASRSIHLPSWGGVPRREGVEQRAPGRSRAAAPATSAGGTPRRRPGRAAPAAAPRTRPTSSRPHRLRRVQAELASTSSPRTSPRGCRSRRAAPRTRRTGRP